MPDRPGRQADGTPRFTASRSSDPGSVATQLEPRTGDSSSAPVVSPAAAPAPVAAQTQSLGERNPWGPGCLHGGGRVGEKEVVSLPPPHPSSPWVYVVGGCTHTHKARGSRPGMANRLSKHCW